MNPAVLKNLSYGMYVIGTKYNGRPNACVANSVIQISSSDPEKVLIALTKDTHSCTAIRENGIFTISVLSTDTPASVIGALGLVSGKNADKLKNIRHKVLIEGVPRRKGEHLLLVFMQGHLQHGRRAGDGSSPPRS